MTLRNMGMEDSYMDRSKRIFLSILFLGIVLILLIVLERTLPASAGKPSQQTEQYCLGCHGKPDLSSSLARGEKPSLKMSADMEAGSVHSPVGIEGEACHTPIKMYPRP